MKTIGIFFIVIVALGLLYLGYKYFVNPSTDGTPCSSTGGTVNDGVLVNGVCIKNEVTNNTPTDTSGPFNAGDDVYVAPLRAGYMYIYSYPNNNSANEIGRTTNALSGSSSIGKYVSMAGNGRFVRVKFNSIIERRRENPNRPGAYFYTNEHATGEYFVPSNQVQNKPY